MSEEIEGLARRLVVGHKRDGRSIYDETAKQELIEACRRPGVSIAKLARECGVNANQVNTWVRQYERKRAAPVVQVPGPTPAFVPVAIEPAAALAGELALQLKARLPNGVVVDLGGVEARNVGEVIEALGRLRCSVSTRS
jgi:transposase